MTSKIKVDNINKVSDDSNIINKCGTTITLGASGDSIALASGASQTGFGRTGTVDWDTTAKTASFTAVSGDGYFVNTTSSAITLTLPASPSAGDIVSVKDYAYTFATNNLTVARNGSPIGGGTGDNIVYATNGTVLTFIYVDGTKGWLVTNESTDTSEAITNTFITATGGTITTCGNYKIHTFTGPGTFSVSAGEGPVAKVDYLVVAGGSAGGHDRGGGGGAGGFRESVPSPAAWTASPLANPNGALPVSIQGYPITVGAGGSTSGSSSPVPNGNNSIFSSITSAGGGGAGNPGGSFVNGNPGGSGGGTRDDPATGGSGNTPPVSPPQGKDGGSSSGNQNGPGGGGGGATEAGFDGQGNPNPATFGDGGDGAQTSINGSATYYAGGGGSGGGGTIPAGGEGGQGGGGNGANQPGSSVAATANTGGGGGAGNGGPSQCAGAGGSGIVIIRYKFQ